MCRPSERSRVEGHELNTERPSGVVVVQAWIRQQQLHQLRVAGHGRADTILNHVARHVAANGEARRAHGGRLLSDAASL